MLNLYEQIRILIEFFGFEFRECMVPTVFSILVNKLFKILFIYHYVNYMHFMMFSLYVLEISRNIINDKAQKVVKYQNLHNYNEP